MGPEFDKMVADLAAIADVVEKIVTTDRPMPIYTASRMARSLTGAFAAPALAKRVAN